LSWNMADLLRNDNGEVGENSIFVGRATICCACLCYF
jgi:hypothetical protein